MGLYSGADLKGLLVFLRAMINWGNEAHYED